MEIISTPIDEKDVLKAVNADADSEEIYRGIVLRAECCVVHLCGCK